MNSPFSLDLLPASVHKQMAEMGVKRRPQFQAGRALLALLMQTYFGCNTLPEIDARADGKPAFCDTSLPHFSLSHSGDAVLVAVCATGEIGGDIEVLRPRLSMQTLAPALFSERENQWLNRQGDNLPAAFWQLWTLREALLKQQGRSVWQMAAVHIDPQQKRFGGLPARYTYLSSVTAFGNAVALALPRSVTHIDAFHYDDHGVLSAWPAEDQARWQIFHAAD